MIKKREKLLNLNFEYIFNIINIIIIKIIIVIMSSSNFEKVAEFHDSFGLPNNSELQNNVFTENTKLTTLRWDLIKEEVDELREAMDTHDMTETIEALTDILYVVYGAGVSFGIDLNRAFEIVHSSNMSKLCVDENEAQDTVLWYKEQFKQGKLPYDSPAYRRSDDEKYWVVFNESTGKILKTINYTPADFKELLQ